MSRITHIIGVDEVGRGPIAGEVAVGAVAIPFSFDWERWREVRDSKQLTPLARERWFARMRDAEAEGLLRFAVSSTGPSYIDARGIVAAIRRATADALEHLSVNPRECRVLLDGGLTAPEIFLFQKTIIRGDQSEPLIALASIAAKVTRDRRMTLLAKKYPAYGFERHKGYGTKAHFARIKEFGLCDLHRRSFLSSLA